MTESQSEPSDFIRDFSHFGRLIDPEQHVYQTVMNTFMWAVHYIAQLPSIQSVPN